MLSHYEEVSVGGCSVCKYFGLSANLDKCVVKKISQKTGSMEALECNNHKIKSGEL